MPALNTNWGDYTNSGGIPSPGANPNPATTEPPSTYAGLSDANLISEGYHQGGLKGLMQSASNILPSLVGLKDIDYPFFK